MKREKSTFRKVFEAVLGFYAALGTIAALIALIGFIFGWFK